MTTTNEALSEASMHKAMSERRAQKGGNKDFFCLAPEGTSDTTRWMAEHPWTTAGVSFGLGVGAGVGLVAASDTVAGFIGRK